MNILLIGNGFDLAHGLPTSYDNFLNFCERARRIYTYDVKASKDDYEKNNIDNWEINDYIKEQLLCAYESRKCEMIPQEDGSNQLKVNTSNKALDTLYTYIKENAWVEYFLKIPSYVGDNWIDFETEISRVIQALDAARFQIRCGGSITGIEEDESKVLTAIWKASKWSLKSAFMNIEQIEKFTQYLNTELEKLTCALEIYLASFVNKIKVGKRSIDIENANPDYVLTFNYTSTYERIYGEGEKIEYDYIHGKATEENVLQLNNMVLGIDEYLSEERKNKEVEFIAFKKFYQRIYKQTGCKYKDWSDAIKEEYSQYLRQKKEYENQPSFFTTAIESFYSGTFPARISKPTNSIHNLYIFGHSLDVTDKDILRTLILNENVHTTIFYHEKKDSDGNGDNGRKELGQKIANLVKVIGQDELIRRTGGSEKTIEFKMQSEMY